MSQFNTWSTLQASLGPRRLDQYQLTDRLLYAEQGLRATGCHVRMKGTSDLASLPVSIVQSDPDPAVMLGPFIVVRSSPAMRSRPLSGEELRANVLLYTPFG